MTRSTVRNCESGASKGCEHFGKYLERSKSPPQKALVAWQYWAAFGLAQADQYDKTHRNRNRTRWLYDSEERRCFVLMRCWNSTNNGVLCSARPARWSPSPWVTAVPACLPVMWMAFARGVSRGGWVVDQIIVMVEQRGCCGQSRYVSLTNETVFSC